jgi:hypothetical protein
MYDRERIQRLKEIIGRHHAVNATADADIRPTSGMLGQSCQGFVPAEGTNRNVRICVRPLTPEDMGPGYYDPFMPTSLRTAKLYSHPHDTDPGNYSVKPGPADYPNKPHPTQLIHNLKPSAPPPVPDPPLGGTLEHPSWLPRPPAPLPQATHPEVHFKTGINTPNFVAGTRREIFPYKFRAPSSVVHTAQKKFIADESEETSLPFKSRVDRFADRLSETPPPTAYTLPDKFGESQTKLIVLKPNRPKSRRVSKKVEPVHYPEPSIIHPPDASHQNTQFMTKRDRFEDASFRTPAPTEYTIDREIGRSARQTKIHKRSRLSKAQQWDYVPQQETPAVGQYDGDRNWKGKAGYISTIGHRPYDAQEDRPLAFRTRHSSLVKKSFNARYQNLSN